MKTNFFATKHGHNLIKIICILLSYILMYGVLVLIMNFSGNNTIVVIVFLIICIFFTYKTFKGALLDRLADLPWAVALVVGLLLSALTGVFTAPFFIGKWIAEKITKSIS